MWMLSLFPMMFLMFIAFRGVYYVGDKKRDKILRNLQLIKDGEDKERENSDGGLTIDEDDVDDKKPLISDLLSV